MAGKAGFVIGRRPRRYEQTRPQSVFKEAAAACGIKKGITKAELQVAMRDCIPKFFADRRQSSG